MRKLTYFISLSIDGFIAGPDDEIDFYHGSEDYMQWMVEDYGDALPTHVRGQVGAGQAPLTRFDTIVMGRRTYEPALAAGITSPYAHLRQIVFSRSMRNDDSGVEFPAEEPLDVVRRLKSIESDLGIYLAGGGTLAGQLLSEIDELIVKRYPVVAGSGIPAFGPAFDPTAYALADLKSFRGGNIVESYVRAPAG